MDTVEITTQLLPIKGKGTIIFNTQQQDNCSFHFANSDKKACIIIKIDNQSLVS